MRLTAALLFLGAPLWAQSDVYISLAGKGGQKPLMALGMPSFAGESVTRGEDVLVARKLQQIVRDDLLFSRYFDIKTEGPAYDGANAAAIAEGWKNAGAGWLLTAKAGSGPKVSLSVQVTDLGSNTSVFERHYRQDEAFLRSLAHRVSDDLVLALTGKAGVAHTQIAFANNRSGNKELFIIDYDGENQRQLTRHGSITMLPRFAPDRRSLAYTSYKDGNPDLFVLDLVNGQSRAVSSEQGLNVAGGFSPDGSQLLMTLSRQKSPNLFVKDFKAGTVTRLTDHFGADSSPTFSPDASQVAFVSDRSGNPQIYVLNVATQRAKRLTAMNWCDSPSWSPTGEWIAFAGRAHNKDKMDIFIVDVTGNQIRQLTKLAGTNENPSWSPDGRFLAFTSTRNGRSELFIMDADGSAPHKVVDMPGGTYTPDWSR